MNLYKVYLVYGKNIVMHLYWARDEAHVIELAGDVQPIIKEIKQKEGCCMCHHIADHNFYKELGG